MFNKINKTISEYQKLQKEVDLTIQRVAQLSDQLKQIEENKKIEELLKSINQNEYLEKLNSIEQIVKELDVKVLKRLNQKIEQSLKFRKTKFICIIILILLVFFASIFVCPLSPVYQKTRQQKLLNDILEKHYTELCSQDDAIKAIEKCNKILEEWNETNIQKGSKNE